MMDRGRIAFWSLMVIFSLVLSGCASSMMMKVATADPPDAGHAVVTFLRPSAFGGAIQFGIWDGDTFVGILSARSYVQYRAEPGEHIFMGRAENWSYVKADLQGGKNYYILGKVFPGVWKARIAFDPITHGDGTTDAEIETWLEKLTPTAVIPEKRAAYVQPRLPDIRAARQAFESKEVKYEILEAQDYR